MCAIVYFEKKNQILKHYFWIDFLLNNSFLLGISAFSDAPTLVPKFRETLKRFRVRYI